MPVEHCPDCPQDATHTLYWHPRTKIWSARPLGDYPTRRHSRYGRYCHWHTTCRAVLRNAAGEMPPKAAMQARVRRVLARQEAPHGAQ